MVEKSESSFSLLFTPFHIVQCFFFNQFKQYKPLIQCGLGSGVDLYEWLELERGYSKIHKYIYLK